MFCHDFRRLSGCNYHTVGVLRTSPFSYQRRTASKIVLFISSPESCHDIKSVLDAIIAACCGLAGRSSVEGHLKLVQTHRASRPSRPARPSRKGSMVADTASVQESLDDFSAKLDSLETALRPVLAALDDVRSGGSAEELPSIMQARVDATLAYALNAMFCMYLRTQGQDPSSHPVRDEIERVRAAYVRIHSLSAGEKGRPRKRKHAAIHAAEQELARVLSDGERCLHQAANGKTHPAAEVGQRKTFSDASDDSDEEVAVSADDADEPESEKKRKAGGTDASKRSKLKKSKEERADKKKKKKQKRDSAGGETEGLEVAKKDKKKSKKSKKKGADRESD